MLIFPLSIVRALTGQTCTGVQYRVASMRGVAEAATDSSGDTSS